MNTPAFRKATLLLALLCLGGYLALDYVPGVAIPAGPVDMVVGIYESSNQPVAEVSIFEGSVANAMRKAGKFRQWDKDQLPAADRADIEPILAKLGTPTLLLIKGGKIVHFEPFPKTGEALAAVVAKYGGL